VDTLDAAVGRAEELLGATRAGEFTTVTVRCAGRLLASFTNRRIKATFHMQYWDRREAAVDCGSIEFDATGYVLRMGPEAVRALRDCRESSDTVGLAHIPWDGPCRVSIEGSVCAFFGVDGMADITDEAFAFARRRWPEVTVSEASLRLTFELRLRVAEGASLGEFIQDLDCRMNSRTDGVTIVETTFVDYQ
jgi:hypothetical protein